MFAIVLSTTEHRGTLWLCLVTCWQHAHSSSSCAGEPAARVAGVTRACAVSAGDVSTLRRVRLSRAPLASSFLLLLNVFIQLRSSIIARIWDVVCVLASSCVSFVNIYICWVALISSSHPSHLTPWFLLFGFTFIKSFSSLNFLFGPHSCFVWHTCQVLPKLKLKYIVLILDIFNRNTY